MRFRPHELFPCILVLCCALLGTSSAAYAQFTIGVTNTNGATQTAPASFDVTASVLSGSPTITKLVLYRNDVPFKTVLNPVMPYQFDQDDIGQDTYAYRARAYTSSAVADSNEIEVIVNTPIAFRLGDEIPAYKSYPAYQTDGPNRYADHTEDIRKVIDYLNWLTEDKGGTVFFPCVPPASPLPADDQSIYNIRETIVIPSNITLQGERAEEGVGRCRVYWRDVDWNGSGTAYPLGSNCYDNKDPNNPGRARGNLLDRPMFQIAGFTERVRIKDLWLYSRSSGPNCDHPRPDLTRIAGENTVAIAIYGGDGDIRDVIVENVSITSFTAGIQATTRQCPDRTSERCSKTDYEITDVKLRAVRSSTNHRQLQIDARYAYDWDIQNFNISGMGTGQAGVDIFESGYPESPVSEFTGLRFLQLNCNGNAPARDAAYCTTVEKHGGLYFKQTHHEGVKNSIIVEDMGFINNDDPIILEASSATGEFKDDSMKLYLIGSGTIAAPLPPLSTDPDKGRLEFIENGVYSQVIDCGDVYWDRTDVNGNPPDWAGWQMQFTHTERNRAAFLGSLNSEPYQVPHTPCPYDAENEIDISKIGGNFFNTGVMPTEVYYDKDETSGVDLQPVYSKVFECPVSNVCDITSALQAWLIETISPHQFTRRGSVYLRGEFEITDTILIPSGMQITGAPNSVVRYAGESGPLFQIDAPLGTNLLVRNANVILRNLHLVTDGQTGKTGIAIIGYVEYYPPPNDNEVKRVGGLSDSHFSGLTIEGFETGIAADQTDKNPMLDGISMKNMTFVGNKKAFLGQSDNASNWNVQNIRMESGTDQARGWEQINGGSSLQGVTCKGSASYEMEDCISLSMAHSAVNGLERVQNVENAVTIAQAPYMFTGIYKSRLFSTLLIRNSNWETSDADPARMNLLGRAFITSMNNVYENFYVAQETTPAPGPDPGFEADLTRVTHCGDTHGSAGYYPNLDATHLNWWVGTPTPTVVGCSKRPYAWDDVVRMGGNYNADPDLADKPMSGDFYDDVAEDYVLYRPGQAANQQSYWFIRRAGGAGATTSAQWGLHGDVPMVGNVFSGTLRSQLIVWRPSSGDWWAKDPYTSSTGGWNFGSSVHNDVPFVGNFVDESGDKDEIGVFRPGSSAAIYYMNPRTSDPSVTHPWTDYGGDIHIADFLGKGYEQIAQFQAGTFYIIDPDDGSTFSVALSEYSNGDVPVVGKFVAGDCAQVGVWRPGEPAEFILQDTNLLTCDDREDIRLVWGTTHTGTSGPLPPDIPLSLAASNGLRKPTVYRQTKGRFPFSMADGQWWVHDLIPTP